MCPAIHISSRSWLRSSSTHEPSDPPLRIVLFILYSVKKKKRSVNPPFSFQPSPLFKRKNKKQEAAGSGRTLLPSKPRDHRGPPARPKFPADANGLLPSDTQHRQSTQAEKPAEPSRPDRTAPPCPSRPPPPVSGGGGAGGGTITQPLMILPQVHLRKPCYDFYFL